MFSTRETLYPSHSQVATFADRWRKPPLDLKGSAVTIHPSFHPGGIQAPPKVNRHSVRRLCGYTNPAEKEARYHGHSLLVLGLADENRRTRTTNAMTTSGAACLIGFIGSSSGCARSKKGVYEVLPEALSWKSGANCVYAHAPKALTRRGLVHANRVVFRGRAPRCTRVPGGAVHQRPGGCAEIRTARERRARQPWVARAIVPRVIDIMAAWLIIPADP